MINPSNKLFLLSLFIMTGCSHDPNEISQIPEASGICFSNNSKTLFVANDEGTAYEISKTGEILRKQYLGDYDLEGVACDDNNNELIFVYEGEDSVIRVNAKTLEVIQIYPIKRRFQGDLILKKDTKHGLEGITLMDDNIFLSNQSHHFKPMIDPSVVVLIKKKNIRNNQNKDLMIEQLIQPPHEDISGMDYHDNVLYMVSDTEDLLIKYDINKQRDIATVKLSPYAQEGLAFDDENNVYIANDNGSVFKYDKNSLGL